VKCKADKRSKVRGLYKIINRRKPTRVKGYMYSQKEERQAWRIEVGHV
jgi:hypothetical protein